jgi:hypothetical protein
MVSGRLDRIEVEGHRNGNHVQGVTAVDLGQLEYARSPCCDWTGRRFRLDNLMCDKVLATPGVGDVAKPAIDELRGKLDTVSRA